MAEQMQPMPVPLGFSTNFMSQTPTTLVMKERLSLSGDDFTIRTVEHVDVIRCEGKAMSLSDRKNFSAPNGQHLFALRHEHFSIPKSWYLEGPNGEKFCLLEGRWTFGKAKIDVKFKNLAGDGSDVVLEVRGGFFDRNADITWNGVPVAMIRREFLNFGEVFGDRQTYGVQVAPNTDLALIAAIVVGLDESRNEK